MIYGFADFELDTAPPVLSRLGKPVKLDAVPFRMLAHLLEQRPVTISKDDLFQAGWGSLRGFSDQRVQDAILAGRRALDDSGKARRFIQAVYSAGYRFVWQAVCQWQDATARATQRAPLTRYIRTRAFHSLVEASTRDFVGRDFIFRAIDDLVQDAAFPSGYIIIRGEPGIGKTALLAELVRRYGYVHHFNIALEGIRTTHDFLTNVCAQLIVQYHLDAQVDYQALPPDVTNTPMTNSGWLSALLRAVAAQQAGHPVLILVDALDEAEETPFRPDENRLYLPHVLPEGIFFVITTRDVYDDRLSVERRRDIVLQDDAPQNYADVRQYIQHFVQRHREAMSQRMAQWGVEDAGFIEVLTERSEGNFRYLVHVLADIRDGKLTAATIDNIRHLPKGLRAYYQHHWRMMRVQDAERFEQYYEPVVCLLAVAPEPISLARLAEWAELPPRRVSEVIQDWHTFLNMVQDAQGDPLYRIYHSTFQSFLREDVGLKPYARQAAQAILRKLQ